MARSESGAVEEYLRELPPERREVVAKVREVILANLPDGYQETMNWGMIAYEVPLEQYPETYNGQPLMYWLWRPSTRWRPSWPSLRPSRRNDTPPGIGPGARRIRWSGWALNLEVDLSPGPSFRLGRLIGAG